ncbi:hypothetical protein P3T76_008505 [Phytophthora citrophthora]|uniref:Uncharacterized protein n=1 Tax=Phytophthora citrophthora TaxID=4793 RepID=A0AAD9GKH4_9STRA|nr:hypothetical protein P3T76_008505 [Phytophthora citrophthora]
MVGSKHKNGIICTFPNCNRAMRTQKFKKHFIRAHLQDGEVYSVEHRRQYEVAREENARSTTKPEPAATVLAVPTMEVMATEPTTVEETAISTGSSVVNEHIQANQVRQQVLIDPQHLESSVATTDRNVEGAVSGLKINHLTGATPMTAQSDHPNSNKRPASAMEATIDAVDPTSVLLMQFIGLMDQRFQELVSKMSEMIDVQKDLIDTLQINNPNGQAPASAFSQAVEVMMKRRKTDSGPRSDENNSSGSAGSGNADTSSADNDSGFAL